MDAIPLISILVLIFAMLSVSEIMKLKKELRKLSKLTGHLKKDIDTSIQLEVDKALGK